MLSLWPQSSAPLTSYVTAHNLQIASVVLALATFAIALKYGRRGNDGGSGGDSFFGDCGDGDGGACD